MFPLVTRFSGCIIHNTRQPLRMDTLTKALEDSLRHERVKRNLGSIEARIILHIVRIQTLRNKHNVKNEIGKNRASFN